MSTPLHVTFHGMTGSDGVERCARQELDKLEQMHPRIEGCRVALEARTGNRYHGGAWVAHVTVLVPGRELTVDHDSGFVDAQEDQFVTIRAAFVGARRLLLLDAKRIRGDAKSERDGVELAKPAA